VPDLDRWIYRTGRNPQGQLRVEKESPPITISAAKEEFLHDA
jgi:hypothetical protein